MSFSCQKGELDRFFNRLDWPVEESRPDRFPSLVYILILLGSTLDLVINYYLRFIVLVYTDGLSTILTS